MSTTMTVIIAFAAVIFGGVCVPIIINWLFDKFGR